MKLIGHISFKHLNNCDFYYMCFKVFSQMTDIFITIFNFVLGIFFPDILIVHFILDYKDFLLHIMLQD